MDVDFWDSRAHSAKHFSAVHASRIHSDQNFVLDDTEGDEDPRPCFPCPFCYVEVEVTSLCNHLQEEHCFDLKTEVCPLCAASLGKDLIGHFMVQHASSLKHRRKSKKSGFWTSASAMLGKELHKRGRDDTRDSAPDPLLSPFICSIPFAGPKASQKNECSDTAPPVACDVTSTEPSSYCEKDHEEKRQRAEFVQQLIASTIF